MHSEHFGTEHRGQVIGSMHGLPATPPSPCMAAMHLPGPYDDIDRAGIMRHRPSAVHRVYADGRTVATLPQIVEWVEGRKVDHGLRLANQIARDYRRIAIERTTVTVDAWCPERATTSAFDTQPDTVAPPSIYAESVAANAGIDPRDWDAVREYMNH